MKNRGLVATIVIMSGIIVILLITLLLVKMPSVFIFDGLKIFKETESIEETKETQEIETTEPAVIVDEPTIDTEIVTYEGYNGNVSIEYPVVKGMEDAELQEKVNFRLKTNALSIVPLYPISTALQNLRISCNVSYLDKNYITVLYSGEVVGKSVGKGSATNQKSSAASSEYLNGYIDPYAANAAAAAAAQAIANQNATNVFSGGSLPLPKSGGATSVTGNTNNNTSSGTSGKSKVLNGSKNSVSDSTADKGPTVYEEPAPHVNREFGPAVNDNTVIGPGMNSSVTQNAPVNGFAGSNTSASTIDQKIFYTNTVDLKTGRDISLKDRIKDMNALAKYARSSKAELINVPAHMVAEVRTYIRKTIEPTLTEHLQNESDFRNQDLKTWPKHFSYEDADGNIYFTIKLSSKLGNYVIIKYNQ